MRSRTIHNENEMIGRRIGKLVQGTGLEVDDFARRVGVNPGRLRQIMAGQLRGTYDKRLSVAKYLRLTDRRLTKWKGQPANPTPEDLDCLFLPGPDEQLRLDL